jgi:hypothetical protein
MHTDKFRRLLQLACEISRTITASALC